MQACAMQQHIKIILTHTQALAGNGGIQIVQFAHHERVTLGGRHVIQTMAHRVQKCIALGLAQRIVTPGRWRLAPSAIGPKKLSLDVVLIRAIDAVSAAAPAYFIYAFMLENSDQPRPFGGFGAKRGMASPRGQKRVLYEVLCARGVEYATQRECV